MLRLLVSVRSAQEVEPALAGGADIVDAKEPANGSLGAVEPPVLAEIMESVPPDRELSIALGDLSSKQDIVARIQRLSRLRRAAPIYLKIGFAGTASLTRIEQLIVVAREATAALGSPYTLIPVAYADWERAGSAPPPALLQLAADLGCGGVLLDTYRKDGVGLFRWLDLSSLQRWVCQAQDRGLLAALAGQLGAVDLPAMRLIEPDIVGVRGAACEGGRAGLVSATRVRALREVLTTGTTEHTRNQPGSDGWAFAKRRKPGQNFAGEPS